MSITNGRVDVSAKLGRPWLGLEAEESKLAPNRENSILPPKGSSVEEMNSAIAPTKITDLRPGAEERFVWDGFLAPGQITLLAGAPKAGKTTLVTGLLKAFEDGGEIGTRVHPAKVFVLSEESERLWCRRRDTHGLQDHVHLACRYWVARPTYDAWTTGIYQIADLVREYGYDAVVIDTLGSAFPVEDENNASQVTKALLPLTAIAEAGAALLLVHHARKNDGGEGRAIRGSSALAGFPDCLIELRRYRAEDHEDTRRVLSGLSRFEDTPAQIVLDWKDGHYVTVGSKADTDRSDRLAVVLDLLPENPPGRTISEILDRWPEACEVPAPRKSAIAADLKAAYDKGEIDRRGKGRKGDPHTFFNGKFVSSTVPLLGGRNEFDTSDSDERAAIQAVEAEAERLRDVPGVDSV